MKTWKILGETQLVSLLVNAENSIDSHSFYTELNAAYDEFTDTLMGLFDDDHSVADALRCLYYIRVELHALQQGSYKAKKKSALQFVFGKGFRVDRIGNRVD